MADKPECDDPTHENSYVCPKDGTVWVDYWTCACDDKCPVCGTSVSPHATSDIDWRTM